MKSRILSRLLAGFLPDGFLGQGMKALSFLRGQGAASGWDIDSEALVCSRVVDSDSPVILDVGAHVGEWSFAVDKLLRERGVKGCYYLFEPSPASIEILKRKKLRNMNLVEAALGQENREISFFEPSPGSSLSSTYPRCDSFLAGAELKEMRVKMESLDSFCQRKGIQSIDFLKMDIEGREFDALMGAKELLGRRAIRAIMFEFGSVNVVSRIFFRDFWDLLPSCGFALYRIRPGGRLAKIEKYTEELEYFRGATNYLAVLGN